MNDPYSSCGATGPGGGATNGWFSADPDSRRFSGSGSGLGGEVARRRKPRRASGFPLPRPLPWPTVLGRAWPGTLIACWTVLTTCVILQPHWTTLGIVGALLAVASIAIRLPLSVAPRPPMWMISGFIGGCIGAWLGDGLEVFLRICVLAIVVLWGSALIAWVTPTAALAGALRVYVRPWTSGRWSWPRPYEACRCCATRRRPFSTRPNCASVGTLPPCRPAATCA